MADPWRPTLRKRLILFALDLAGRITTRATKPAAEAPESNAAIRDILVIELWNIGDLVLTLPFLAQLQATFPQAKITLLGRPYAREVLGGAGLVDEFIVADLGWGHRNTRGGLLSYDFRELRRVIRELRRRSFDVAFKSRAHVREHALLSVVRAKRKIAYSLGAGDYVLTDPIARDISNTHKVDDWLGLLAPFGGSRDVVVSPLTSSRADSEWADSFLAANGISHSQLVIGIHPGASVLEKRWPLRNFAQVAEKLSSVAGRTIIAFTDESGYGGELGDIKGVVSAGGLSIPQLIALIGRCDVLVCNDSGPMHLAAAMNVPVVAIFGEGIARWFSPLGDGHQLLQGSNHCGDGDGISRISVVDVLAAVEKTMAR